MKQRRTSQVFYTEVNPKILFRLRTNRKVLRMFVAFGSSRTPTKNAFIRGYLDDAVYYIAINPEHLELKILGYDWMNNVHECATYLLE